MLRCPPVCVLRPMDEQKQVPEDLEEASPLPVVLFLARSHGARCPQVFVSGASCAWMENGSPSPGHSPRTTRPGSQAGSLRLAACCEGGCITGLSAGHGACWFRVRRSSQSKQVHNPLPLPRPWCAGLPRSPSAELARSGAGFTAELPGHHHRVPGPEPQVFSNHLSQVCSLLILPLSLSSLPT